MYPNRPFRSRIILVAVVPSECSCTGTEARRRELGIRELPASLGQVLGELASGREFLRPVFPASLLENYEELKRDEQLQLNLRPHSCEFYRYLDV